VSRPVETFAFRVTGVLAGARVSLGIVTEQADTWYLAREAARRTAQALYAGAAIRDVDVERLASSRRAA
jgi:hypothetical protein